MPEDEQERIMDIALAHAEVLGVHELRTRQSGRIKIIQLHVELDGEMPLWRAHEICEDVEQELRDAFPRSDVLLHQDPFRPKHGKKGRRKHRVVSGITSAEYPAH